MAWFLGKKEDREASGLAITGKEVTPAAASQQPTLGVCVEFVGAFEWLVGVLLRGGWAPAPGVMETDLGGNHMTHCGVGGSIDRCIGAGMELQLGRVHDLDLWYFDGDDDAAGGDRWLVGETNNRVILLLRRVSIINLNTNYGQIVSPRATL